MIKLLLFILYLIKGLTYLKIYNDNLPVYYFKNTLINYYNLTDNCNKLNNKNIITISPGGYKGFYQLGIASYTKENYKVNDYLFSGASAGAWVSLMMVYKGDHNILIKDLINIAKTINNKGLEFIQKELKHVFLSKYTTSDFDLSRIFIGVIQFDKLYNLPYTSIYTDFNTLEEAVDCCIASSHIPLVTGGLIKKYNNKISFDGGFSNYPYLQMDYSSIILNIHLNLWFYTNNNNNKLSTVYNFSIYDFTNIFYIHNFNLSKMYHNGYTDSKKYKDKLNNIFL
jgi:hypothetical protein